MNKEKAVIFDLEGVIVSTERVWDDIGKEFLGRHGIVYDRDKVKHLMMGRTIKEGVAIMQEVLGLGGDIEELTAERRAIAKELLAKEIQFEPGAKDFIAKACRFYKIAIASGIERAFFLPIDAALHLSATFNQHIYTIEDVNFVSKPNPDIFLHAARQISVEPGSCVVIEDSPNGIEAAKRAGMKCVGITHSLPRERLSRADRIVDSFSEIQLDDLWVNSSQ